MNTTKPLIIGVDVRELKKAKTGIKTFLEELCREFKNRNEGDLKFYFFDTSLPVYTGKNKPLKWLEHLNYQIWKQLVLPVKAWSKKCDIVFCVDNCVPYIHLGYQTIFSIHDAFCFESPQHYGKLWLWLYKNTATPGARRSPYVITATAYGKKQVAHYMELDPDKMVVVYDGPKRVNYNPDANAASIVQSLPITKGNYILHVGAMFKRKNIVSLIKAFGIVKQQNIPDLKLVLAGPLVSNKFENEHQLILDTIADNSLKDDVIITGFLSDAEIGQLYENALMYVFPSTNEGFGLPILEAFEHHLPVLVSNNTCLPEVGGDAVLQFDPYDINEMVQKINTVLNDAELRKEMIKKGDDRLKEFSWEKTAREIIAVFKKAANYS